MPPIADPITMKDCMERRFPARTGPEDNDGESELVAGNLQMDPATQRCHHVLALSDKCKKKQFGLGLVAYAPGPKKKRKKKKENREMLSAIHISCSDSSGRFFDSGMGFDSDAWWLEHYAIGSRPDEDLVRPSGKVTY